MFMMEYWTSLVSRQHERLKVHKKSKEQVQPPQGADQGDHRQVSDFCI